MFGSEQLLYSQGWLKACSALILRAGSFERHFITNWMDSGDSYSFTRPNFGMSFTIEREMSGFVFP